MHAGRADSGGTGQYTVRPYEPGDRAGLIDLYERVSGAPGDEWFRWKFERNPYVDSVPIVVGTYRGAVVAARPCFALELRVEGANYLALQPTDLLVDPDHRRNGLYDRTIELMKHRYAEREAALFFQFADASVLPRCLDHGWAAVGRVPTAYRVRRPAALAPGADRLTRLALALAGPVARAYLAGRAVATTTPPEELRVEKRDGVAVGPLLAAYRTERPRGLHALRDSRYYDWRFERPAWDYRTYVVRRDDVVVAALVVGRRRGVVSVLEALPLAGADRRTRAFGALLDAAVADHGDAAVVVADGSVLPRDLLASRGFLRDDGPLERVVDARTLVAFPLVGSADPAEWTLDGLDLANPTNWTLSLGERDSY